ncbi:Bro-N domain-containing protein [Pseudomonas sp. CBSPBW29]|jgi:prophage antirepressor-like protein|uniref:BRO-N domain-containing protein n=1 Tax=Pseudomonas TaxID=286 RepID=UPI0021AD4C15|nr:MULTISPECIES: Bro-N domain-containing protein [unclassified Pseudomonas]WEL41966.1 Bro-N domain-containing protein [Pseudomonas sp. CBSPBW29]WEL63027.1 Bro-N domain-containing protein [Pseudomonas sp. CBSPGW29]WEL72217.1 Bro-N domain-containing protein [Pseudomonas sp. CBSPCGW29]WEL79115.1 Bro-N domain-containing protein [Pseudomonas sp. CBSPAW29]WEL82234.1 Bro-N domain-containing protein [Pseudomonas sp. CBSPCAW29]WEL90711.1 Bro-N domain-containing protein [Pseudomonas sp. CBSPCBW29]
MPSQYLLDLSATNKIAKREPSIAIVFTRHNLHLHALLLENQPWFCARDLGRLMGYYLDERTTRKLDGDQRRTITLLFHGQPEEMLMISESGAYALLVYHYTPGNRLLRGWLTHEVVPTLRDERQSQTVERPLLSMLDWPEMSLNLLHWQDEGWIRLRDMPYLLVNRTYRKESAKTPWWRRLTQPFRMKQRFL